MATFMAFKGDSTIGIIPTTPCTRIVIFFFTISALTIKKDMHFSNYTTRIAAEEFLDEILMKNLW